MKSALVTGAAGMLGTVVSASLELNGWGVTRLVRGANSANSSRVIVADLAKQNSLKTALHDKTFDACVHCAAITNLDTCEHDPNLASETHVVGTRRLIESASFKRFVYISTDSVFDGTSGNMDESNLCNPINVYSKTKHEGEIEAQKHDAPIVIRTNMYDIRRPVGGSLAEWAFSKLSSKTPIRGYGNVMINPLHTSQIAKGVQMLLEMPGNFKGVIHFGCDRFVSKFNFLQLLARQFDFDGSLIEPTTFNNTPDQIQRPVNTTLNTHKLQRILPNLDCSLSNGLLSLREKVCDT